jgi:outer membrane receptor protein involved in Fe transport
MKYAEMIYDREILAGRGLLTGGVSYREKDIQNAPIWDDYLPDFLGPDNDAFLPQIIYRDYRTELWSLFAQYNQKIGNLNLAAGFRQDMHDEYKDHLSMNTSAVWTPSSRWVLKLLYGTAYRTPFSGQLLQEDTPDLEEIQSFNAQLVWMPIKPWTLSTTFFLNHIENHVMEDPYAGLSEPNEQDIRGVEVELRFEPSKRVVLAANMTLMDNSGPDETYRYNDFDFVRPDGTVVPHYVDLSYPYDAGPDALANITATWQPVRYLTVFGRLGYSGSKKLVFPRGDTIRKTSDQWLTDVSVTLREVFGPGWALTATVKNLLDDDYQIPGTYSLIEGAPFRSEIKLEKRW